MDAGVLFQVLLVPVRDPARQAADGEHDREHVHRDVQGAQDESGIEVHVGIELARQEIVVLERDLFEFLGDVQERVRDVQGAEQVCGAFLQNPGPGVEVLVDPVPKTHQSEFLAFYLLDAILDREIPVADAFKHLHHGGVGPAVQPSPQGADAGGNRSEEVGLARSDHAHRGTGAVLLMVGVHQQKLRQGLLGLGGGHVLLVGHGEHHVQQVLAIGAAGIGIDDGQTGGLAVTEGRDGAHLADQLGHGLAELRLGLDIEQVGVVGAQGIDDRRKDGHGVPVGRKPFEVVHEVFVQQGRIAEHGAERGPFLAGRQLSENKQHDRFHEGALPRQLLNGIAPIPQNPLLAVHKGDGAVTRTGIGVALIQGDDPGAGAQTAHVHRDLAFGATHHRQFIGLAVNGQRGRIFFLHISSCDLSPRQEKDQS